MRSGILSIGCVVLAVHFAGAQQPPANADGLLVGLYEFSPGQYSLVTAGATNGPFLLDFDAGFNYEMVPLGHGVFRWGRDERKREGRFVAGNNGKTAELHWRGNNKEGIARRSETVGYTQEEVTFKSGDLNLAGVVFMPRTAGPHAGVVLVQGSGPGSRDNTFLLILAHHLAMSGNAVLVPDKRGAGKSAGDWKSVDFWELATDALAGAELLRAHTGVDPRRVGLLGFSQGGWIVPLAATRSRNVAFVVNLSGPAVTVREQTYHEKRNDLKRAGVSDASIQEVFDLMAVFERHLRGEMPWHEYEAALRAKRAGLSGPLVKDFPDKPDRWELGFYHRVGAFDPLPYWRRVEVPFLILYGELDDQDKSPVKASVTRLREGLAEKDPARWTVKVFADTGHGFGDRAKRGIRKDFLEYLTGWVRDKTAP